MLTQDAVQVIEAYFRGHDENYFAEDSRFHDMSQPEPILGRSAIGAFMHMFYVDAFSDAEAEVKSVLPSGDSVVVEFVFRGRNTGSLAGMPPTGRDVSLPMACVYQVKHSEIQTGRLYYDSASLLRQLATEL